MRLPIQPVPKHVALARYFSIKALCKDSERAIQQAAQFTDTPVVQCVLKGEVDPEQFGSNPLATFGMADTYMEIEKGFSILGALAPSMRPGILATSYGNETSGASCDWVSEGLQKPVARIRFGSLSLPPYKVAPICVLTEELALFSRPGAERIVAESLPRASAAFLDRQFLDKAVAGVAGVNPSSVTFGAQNVNSTGASAAQITADLSSMADLLAFWAKPFVVLRPKTLAHVYSVCPTFFSMSGSDLMLFGTFRVIASVNCPSIICMLDAGDIVYADGGLTGVNKAKHTTVIMSDGNSPFGTEEINLWQSNYVGLKAERLVSWQRAHSTSAVSMTVAY